MTAGLHVKPNKTTKHFTDIFLKAFKYDSYAYKCVLGTVKYHSDFTHARRVVHTFRVYITQPEFRAVQDGQCSSVKSPPRVNAVFMDYISCKPSRDAFNRSLQRPVVNIVLCAALAVRWHDARTSLPSVPSATGKQSCQATSTPFRQEP